MAGYYYFAYTGSMVVAQTGAATAAMCAPNYGALYTFNFCYYIDNSAATTNPYFTYAYGTITATGLQLRQGRPAYTMQSMEGIRSYVNVATGVVNNSNIIGLEYINSDLVARGFISDNLLYQSPPYLSADGFIMTVAEWPVFPQGVVTPYNGQYDTQILTHTRAELTLHRIHYPLFPVHHPLMPSFISILLSVLFSGDGIGSTQILDIAVTFYSSNAATNGVGMYEQSVYYPSPSPSGWSPRYTAGSTFNFTYSPYTPGSLPTAACASSSPYITPATLNVYSFCYLVQGPDSGGWQVATQGTLTVNTAPIYSSQGLLPNPLAYAVVNASGTRTYRDNIGNNSVVTITGVAGNNQGGFGWYYDNLMYATSPYFDWDGILLTFSGTAMTVDGPVTGDSTLVFNYFWWYQYQEEAYDANVWNIIGAQDAIGTVFAAANDGGASANSILSASTASNGCGYSPTATFQNQYQYIPFCYTITQTLSTSPYLPWSVSVTGTLQVVANSMTTGWQGQYAEPPGYLVVGASGTRVIYQGGKAAVTSTIVGLAAPNTYNGNDNVMNAISGGGPYFDPSAPHGLTFIMSAQPVFAAGTAPGNMMYVNINNYTTGGSALQESDNPANDGETSVVVSTFTIGAPVSSLASSWGSCPNSITQPTLPSGVTSATIAATTQAPFCYTFAGVDPYGNTWTLQASGIFTLSGYMATTVSGRTAYLIVGASGTRTISSYAGNVSNTITGIGGVNAVAEQGNAIVGGWGYADYAGYNSYWYSNNVYYPSFPYFDVYGVSLQSSTQFWNLQWPPFGSYQLFQGSNTAVKIFNDPATYQFSEWLLDLATGYYYVNDAGTVVVTSYNGATSNGGSLASFYAQCSPTAGPLQTFSFCYYIDGSNQNSYPFFDYAYGTFTATGPVTRQGRQAYTMQGIQGIRTFITAPGTVNATNSSVNIIGLQYLTYDEGYGGIGGLDFWTLNDNLVYVAGNGPVIDATGFIFTTGQPAQFPGGSTAYYTSDVLVRVNQTGNNGFVSLIESSVGSGQQAMAYGMNRWGFNYQPYQAGVQPTCAAGSSASPSGTTTWSFCYVIAGTQWNSPFSISAMGTITTYNAAISQDGLLSYGIIGAAGYRQYQDGIGNNSYVTINGLASNTIGGSGWLYNNVLFATSPYFDTYGLLYTYSGTAMTPNGPVVASDGVPVINIFYSLWSGNSINPYPYQEEAYTQAFGLTYPTQTAEDVFGSFAIRNDNGGSFTSGAILRQGCNYTGTIPAGYAGQSSSSSSGGSGLSKGAIAGIVIGSVAGLVVLLGCIFLMLVPMSRRKGEKETSSVKTNDKYSKHELESSVNASQVEMADGGQVRSETA